MNHDLTLEQVIPILSSAFSLFDCVATPQDRGNRLQYQVLDGDESLLFQDGLLKRQVTNSRHLEGIISYARSTLEERGRALAGWSFPSVPL